MKPERLEEIRRALKMRPAYPLGKQEVVDLAEELLAELDRMNKVYDAMLEDAQRRQAHACQCTECEP